MFCTNCGKEIPDGTAFCIFCGAAQRLDEPTSTPITEKMATPAAAADGTPGAAAGDGPAQATPLNVSAPTQAAEDVEKKKKMRIVIIAVACVAVLAAVGIGVALFLNQPSSNDSSKRLVSVPLTITAPGYSDSSDTPFPFHVEGTSDKGDTVSKDVFARSSGSGISLEPGSYKITATASPLMANGTLFSYSSTAQSVKVEKDGATSKPAFSYTVIDAASITDEQVSSACSMALASGTSQATVDSLKAALDKNRSNAKGTAAAATTTQAAPTDTTQYPTYYVSASESVTLRSEPSTSATDLADIPYNTPISYIETASNGFYKVSYIGQVGYVLSDFVSSTPNPPKNYGGKSTTANTSSSTYYVRAAYNLTLRSSPSTSASALASIPSRASVTYISGASNGFTYVSYNGTTGYVLSEFISSDPNASLDYSPD